MTKIERLLLGVFCLLPGIAAAQPLDPAVLTKTLSDSWPTYSGDYSGKRYSALTQVNQSNVRNLTLAWTSRVTAGAPTAGGGRGGFGGFGGGPPTIVGGEGTGDTGGGGFGSGANIRASIFGVHPVLYFSTPGQPWAADAPGRHAPCALLLETQGGNHIRQPRHAM